VSLLSNASFRQLDSPETEASDLQRGFRRRAPGVVKEHILKVVRAIAALVSAYPLFAQYGGPAILARGQSPAAMSASQIDFRPFLTLNGSYDEGLNGVSVDSKGALVNDSSYGVSVGFGVSGFHSWKHTRIGLDYSGGFSHYVRSYYDGFSGQTLNLSISHQMSRHAMVSFNNSAGLYGSNHVAPSLPQTVEFDPTTANVPTNDFFDNRTINLSSQANLTLQRSTRLSLNFRRRRIPDAAPFHVPLRSYGRWRARRLSVPRDAPLHGRCDLPIHALLLHGDFQRH
jgi:hypothetical protein